MSQPADSTPESGVTWHGAVLVCIPVAFVAALVVGAVVNASTASSAAYGAAASLAVTGYAMSWPGNERRERN